MRLRSPGPVRSLEKAVAVADLFIVNVEIAIFSDDRWLAMRRSESMAHALADAFRRKL